MGDLSKQSEFRGEQDIFRVKYSKKRLIVVVIVLVILGIVMFFLFDLFNIPEALDFLLGDKFWVSIAPLVAIGLVILVAFLDWNSKGYILTTKRVEMDFGIIFKSEKSIANNHIEFVRYEQDFISGLLGHGDVIVNSAGGGCVLIFKYIDDPSIRASQIEEQIKTARLKEQTRKEENFS